MPPVDPNAPPAEDPTADDLFANAVDDAIANMGISMYQSDQMLTGIIAMIKDEEAAAS